MKKIVTILAVLTLYITVNAQLIDVVGKGAYNNASTELIIDDVGSVDYIVVEAVYKSPDPIDGPVEFVSGNESILVDATPVEFIFTENGTDYGVHPSYFRTTMQPASSITLNTLNNVAGVHSFVAYVFRTLPNPDHYSMINYDHGFFYKNGDFAPGVTNIAINTASEERDITTTAVIAELSYDTRLCVITVTAGDKSETLILDEPNSGANLTLEPITLTDVAGDVDNVEISIYSPWAWGTGDSFISGNIVVDVEETFDPCLTNSPLVDLGDDQLVYFGYNPMASADLTASVSGGTAPYTYLWSTGETTDVITVCPEENTTYTVTVTDANGCEAIDDVEVEVVDVRCGWRNRRVLICHTSFWCPNIQYTVCVKKWMVPWLLWWGDQMGSCDLYKSTSLLSEIPEFESEFALREFDKQFYQEEFKTGKVFNLTNEVNVYPNPVNDLANIEFTVDSENATVIELYSLMGKKVKTLYEGSTRPGEVYNTILDASGLVKGVYLVILRNGESAVKQKININ